MKIYSAVLWVCVGVGCMLGGAVQVAAQDLVVTPKGGVVLWGPGEGEFDCNASGAFGQACMGTQGFDSTEDTSGLVLGADVMLELDPAFQVGVGALFQTQSSFKTFAFFGTPISTVGMDLSLVGVVESLHRVGEGSLRVGVRGQGGVLLFFPGDDLSSSNDSLVATCEQSGGTRCDADSETRLGWTAGGGLVFQGVTHDLNLRMETVAQYMEYDFGSYVLESPQGKLDANVEFSGWRALVLFGVSFGGSSS